MASVRRLSAAASRALRGCVDAAGVPRALVPSPTVHAGGGPLAEGGLSLAGVRKQLSSRRLSPAASRALRGCLDAAGVPRALVPSPTVHAGGGPLACINKEGRLSLAGVRKQLSPAASQGGLSRAFHSSAPQAGGLSRALVPSRVLQTRGIFTSAQRATLRRRCAPFLGLLKKPIDIDQVALLIFHNGTRMLEHICDWALKSWEVLEEHIKIALVLSTLGAGIGVFVSLDMSLRDIPLVLTYLHELKSQEYTAIVVAARKPRGRQTEAVQNPEEELKSALSTGLEAWTKGMRAAKEFGRQQAVAEMKESYASTTGSGAA